MSAVFIAKDIWPQLTRPENLKPGMTPELLTGRISLV
jgi:hypothetical protein